MGFKTDIEIAQECTMEPITAIAEKAGIEEKYLEQYGKYKAKIDYNLLKESDKPNGKLILVTAINPTPAGEGKTTTTWTGIWCKRWSRRRWICTGSSDGRYQSAFYR